MTLTDVLLRLLWVAAHHGLRQRTEMVLGMLPGDAYQPRQAILGRQWAMVHDLAAVLGHPPAPSRWTVRR